jgi:hypothetical protein
MAVSEIRLHIAPNHDGGILFDRDHNKFVPLNSTGAYVWQELEQGKSTSEIIDSLAHATGSDFNIVSNDVRTFLDDLRSKNLLPVSCGGT